MSGLDERLSEESEFDALPSYYREIENREIRHSIKNFDDKSNYEQFCSLVLDEKSENFLVDYGDNEAYCAFNLSAKCIGDLVKSKRPPALKTRWINIWVPYKQPKVLEVLAKQYQIPSRLHGFIRETPPKPVQIPRSSEYNSATQSFENNQQSTSRSFWSRCVASQDLSFTDRHDPERHASERTLSNDVFRSRLDNFDTHYSLVNRVWHWTSIDWNRKYVSISYNSLYGNENGGREDVEDEKTDSGRPRGKRIWTWLFLLTDDTVLSVTEDPYPYQENKYSGSQKEMIHVIRNNLANAFRQLSTQCDISNMNPMKILPLRKRKGNAYAESIPEPEDAPGLLFYTLFDDWDATYRLIARKEDQYSGELNELRRRMLGNADLGHADKFHRIGRQLSTLKRLYQGYELLIERLLEKRKDVPVAFKDKEFSNDEHSLRRSETSVSRAPDAERPLGVTLPAAARVRFERLRDRIRLYALSEIQDCLDEKESLVKMNFNLIAIKESRLVERFTRAALVLTKITILFLPITVMSSYFSTDLIDTQFTVRTFWTAFAIVLGSSLILIFAFGAYSGTMEEDLNHKPLSKRFWDDSRTFLKKKKKKQHKPI